MFFTQEDYLKIQQWLQRNSVKDTEFQEAADLIGNEVVTLVQNGSNKKVYLNDLVNQIFSIGVTDFINVSSLYEKYNITLSDAIKLVPYKSRKRGQVITFLNTEGNWEIYQFTGVKNQWNNIELWKDLFDWQAILDISFESDEEDITSNISNEEEKIKLSFKNREYDPLIHSGLGYKILRKNIVQYTDPTYGELTKNILYQDMVSNTYTIYEIRYDFDLEGDTINIPEGCVLKYNGGSLSNGTLIYEDTIIEGVERLSNVNIEGNYRYPYTGDESNPDTQLAPTMTQFRKLNTQVNNIADDEDLTKVYDSEKGQEVLQLKDRQYVQGSNSGMGYVILRQNKSFAEQVIEANTIYEIRYDFDLGGEEVEIPENCVLKFEGGSLCNGVIIGNNTVINASNEHIFHLGSAKYTAYSLDGKYSVISTNTGGLRITGTWNNSYVNPMWVGLTDIIESEDSSIKINAYIKLHDGKSQVVLPYGKYPVYNNVNIINCTVFDGSNSTIYQMNFLDITDENIAIPSGSERKELRSKYGVVNVVKRGDGAMVTVKNLVLDGTRDDRTEDDAAIKVGNTSMLNLQEGQFTLKDIEVKNTIFSAITTAEGLTGLYMYNCYIHNVGEHGIYLNQNTGELILHDTIFENTGDNEWAYDYRGASDTINIDGIVDANINNFKALYYNCKFLYNEDNNRAPLTPGDRILNQEFYNCEFQGCRGYNHQKEVTEATGNIAKYKFYGCINPPYGYSCVDVISELYDCVIEKDTKQYTSFFTGRSIVSKCSGYWRYGNFNMDSMFSDIAQSLDSTILATPLIIKDCNFMCKDSEVLTYNVDNAHDISLTNCVFDFLNYTQTSTFFELKTLGSNFTKSKLDFNSCIFNFKKQYYLFRVHTPSDVSVFNCKKSGNTYHKAVELVNKDSVCKCSGCASEGWIMSSQGNYIVENFSVIGGFNPYKREIYKEFSGDTTIKLSDSDSARFAAPSGYDLNLATKVTQLNNFTEEVVCSVVFENNQIHINLSGVTKLTKVFIVIDFSTSV